MLEGYITPLLMSYIDKYVKNIKPSDLQLSFWGGAAVLKNLELRLDVLEQELRYPLEFKSGKIRELMLHIPWNAIISRPVEVVIKDLEFVVKLKDIRTFSPSGGTSEEQRSQNESSAASQESTDGQKQAEEQTPGGYMSRISHNVIFHIENLVVKVIEEECDMVLTINVGSIDHYATDEYWKRMFMYTDYYQGDYSLHKMFEVKDLVINLQTIESQSSGQGDGSREPFVQRCSFSCRLKYDYQGNVLAKKSTNVLFEAIDFSTDEQQFCLFIHFIDWILAMYYTSKRLKGRDDLPSSSKAQASPEIPPSLTSEGYVDIQSPAVLPEEPSQYERSQGQNQGWGEWVWSFVGDTPDGGQQRLPGLDPSKPPSSTFAMFSKSVTINFKVTHQIQVPVFFSVKSFTRPVLKVDFTGCMFQLDKEPSTQLFLVSVGIMSVEASVTGPCACVKKPPSAWRTGAANDMAEQVRMKYSRCALYGMCSVVFMYFHLFYLVLTLPPWPITLYSGFILQSKTFLNSDLLLNHFSIIGSPFEYFQECQYMM